MATIKNVRVKVRFSALESEIQYRGGIQNRPGRQNGPQSKAIYDAPVLELPLAEYEQRKGDIEKVLRYGWELSSSEPPEIWMGDVAHDAVNSLVLLSAKVRTNNVSSACGFYMSYNKEFDPEYLLAASETPVQSTDDEKITHSLDVSGMGGVTIYFRAYADDGTKKVFSIIKSLELPALI